MFGYWPEMGVLVSDGLAAPGWRDAACTPQSVVVDNPCMKQYVVDQLRYPDYEKLKACLDQTCGPAELEGIYWVGLEEELLTPVQAAHQDCRPFVAAIDLQETRLSLELLVRTRSRIRCSCIAYADDKQRSWLIGLVDRMLAQLEISV
jgi:hypothetical protein